MNFVSYLGIFHVIILLSSYPFFCQAITNRVAECSKIIPICGDISVLDQREMQVSIEALFHALDVFQQRDFAKGDGLFLFQVALWSLCHVLAWRESTPFRHKNKQKLVCKTANTPRSARCKSFEVKQTGGWCFRWEFLVVPNLATKKY